jgi:hypothetical protein
MSIQGQCLDQSRSEITIGRIGLVERLNDARIPSSLSVLDDSCASFRHR